MPPHKAGKKKKARSKPLSVTAEFEQLLKQTKKNGRYILRLYITGTTPRSTAAIANIRSLCEEYLPGRYDLKVVDIYQQPSVAAGEQIIAAPTLVKEFPAPSRRMVGDLGDRQRVLVGLDLKERGAAGRGKTKWAAL